MIVADASWLIALTDPADVHHDDAVELAGTIGDEDVLLHPVTLAECLVGAAVIGELDAAEAEFRRAFEIVEVDVGAPRRWAQLKATTHLRLPDAIVLDTATFHGATMILTFDRELAATARSRSIGTGR
jgi:predicted nucleic acid-binding protein